MEFNKSYNPKEFEKNIYQKWLDGDKFLPKKSETGKTFYIPMPPPNVTGNLHIGHSLTLALEDIMVRYHRLKGDETLWIPGTDHAGISTQNVVEKKLSSQGISRTEIGREKFISEVWKWKDEYHKNITDQIKLMGASCDWSKERFTLDEGLNKTVEYTFCDLYNKGLIYRGEYMVNFSPALQTVVSDIEVVHKEEETNMYYITYFVSGSDNELIIATTRPETLLADQAIAVNPKDKRYKKMIGRNVILPIVNKEIPIIGDDNVDKDFGTGVLKITPAHDPADFQIAKKHNLKLDFSAIDRNGRMTREAGIFAGQDYITARQNIVELLRSKGNLVKIEPYTHKVGYCERTGCKIETVVSTQWFVKSSEMVNKVIAGYKKKEFTIVPERYNKTLEDWIFNLRDWCISRQLWWGHQIPAYFDVNTGELVAVSEDEQGVYDKYGKDNVKRDEDVLDTWFSSSLWP
ncbi:MAG: valine--tRNA ligase, partial [Candidatus Gracilibacteria bacterium]|nr:valine--tRNA ligase [Candidatus Gracilibacteria bacterium]